MNKKLLEKVYIRYARELYLYLYSLCKDSNTAEDLVQETFVKAILSLPDEHPNFRAWLYRVGKNLYLNHLKRNQKEELREKLPETPDVSEEMLNRYIRCEENQRIYREILSLQSDQRQVIILFYFAECSTREISEIMGLGQGHVRMLLTRARRNLKDRLEEGRNCNEI